MFIYFFIFFFLWAIIEGVLSTVWSIIYFRTGIPIYKRVSEGVPVSFSITDVQKIEALMPIKKPGKILIKYVQDNFFLFREHAYRFKFFSYGNSSFMHGSIIIEPQKGLVKVIGRLSWITFLGVPCLFFYICWVPIVIEIKFFALTFLSIITAVGFIFQKNIYDEIAEILSSNLELLDGKGLDKIKSENIEYS